MVDAVPTLRAPFGHFSGVPAFAETGYSIVRLNILITEEGSHVNSQLSGSTGTFSNFLSQGGTDPSR